MPVEVDPIASLTTGPIDFDLGGESFQIPAHSAAQWLVALLEDFGSFGGVIELLPVSDKARLEQAVIDGDIFEEDQEAVFRDATELVAGRPWWVVLNYLSMARTFWSRFHGRILISSLDPNKVTLGAYLDAFYYAMIENRDDQSIQKINNYLETPPPGLGVEIDQEAEGDTFLAMMNQAR